MKDLTILTGASRGMGFAMAAALLEAGHTVLCISRSPSEPLRQLADRQGATLLHWPLDLAHADAAGERLQAWLSDSAAGLGERLWHSATLINNAGFMPRIGPLSEASASDLAHALRVGLEAPMLLTAAFLRATNAWDCPRKVLNISSGLGRRAMASQSAYCAAKAGMDHFTRCLALEEARQPNGARVCALAPGVIATDMQQQLRSADADAFPDHARFVQLHEQGQLSSPEESAAQVLAYLARPDFGSQPVADVRD